MGLQRKANNGLHKRPAKHKLLHPFTLNERQHTTSFFTVVAFEAIRLTMDKATLRIRRGFTLLGIVFLCSVVGYRMFHGLDWLEATWLVIITISGVGFSEQSGKPPEFQAFTILVIVFGMVSAAYAVTGLIQMLLAGELEQILGKRRMAREINKLRNHVIICGYGRLGQSLAADLTMENRPFVVVENEPQQAEIAETEGYLVLCGDATEEEVLVQGGLTHAKSLVSALPTDAANVFITLTARNLNRDVQIIARAENASTETKLQQAGANKIVMPAATSARYMLRLITRPSTAHLIELMGERSFQDYEMDELEITEDSPIVGKSVRDSQVHYVHKLLVVAVKQGDDSMVFNPGGDYQFQAHDTAIVMGKQGDIDSFCKLNRLQ